MGPLDSRGFLSLAVNVQVRGAWNTWPEKRAFLTRMSEMCTLLKSSSIVNVDNQKGGPQRHSLQRTLLPPEDTWKLLLPFFNHIASHFPNAIYCTKE